VHRLLPFLLLFLLVGCDNKSTNNNRDNTIPVANAGSDQYLNVGTRVLLDGSASRDEDGDTLSYSWTLIEKPTGSSISLSLSETRSPFFTPDLEGDYLIKLVVNDGSSNSEPDYVSITARVPAEPSTGPQAENQIFTATSAFEARPMLVIRLDFANQHFIDNETVWQNKLFGTQHGELNDYYHEISHNKFEFSPVTDDGNVTDGIVTVTFNSDHPDPDIDASDFTSKLHTVLKAAIETVSADGFDFSIYDTNGDNSISPDELIITFIMAGEEDSYSGGQYGNGVWAHQWCTQSTYTPTVDNVEVMACSSGGNYAVFGERHKDSTTISHNATVGIMAHELGHSAFALPDLYYGSNTRIGYYGLMSNGSWAQVGTSGYPGDTPTHMCAWSKIDTGWYGPTSTSSDPTTDLQVHATGTANYNIIKTPFNNASNEYFLVENRGDSGYDAGLKYVNDNFTGGIAIWHIDESVIQAKRASNTINSNAAHKGVDLEEAAGPSVDTGAGDPVLNLYYSGNIDSFTPNTFPNTDSYDDNRSMIFFTDISSISDTMTVRINNPQ